MSDQAKPAAKVVIYYDSQTHGKRRYFVAGPDTNPAKDGKPQWTYEKKEARVFTIVDKMVVSSVIFMCYGYGYANLHLEGPGPTLTLIDGGKPDKTLAEEFGLSDETPDIAEDDESGHSDLDVDPDEDDLDDDDFDDEDEDAENEDGDPQ